MDLADMMARPPLHEFVADTLAHEAHHEIKAAVRRALSEFDDRGRHIVATHNRSIAQRRRFWRIRILTEKKA
jgi:uncharacterized protein YlaN (UPF0358 family)